MLGEPRTVLLGTEVNLYFYLNEGIAEELANKKVLNNLGTLETVHTDRIWMLIISGKEIPTDILFNDVFPVLLVNGKALVANPKKVNPSTVTFNTIGTKVSNEEPDKVYFVKKVGPLNKTGEEQVFLVLIEDFEKSKVAP